ncbi:MAG: hypothetical protein NTW21_14505 [Verrucomicrobia bacterium]|nr:hypothetical protein [Verrucomicrobiota bacterium]
MKTPANVLLLLAFITPAAVAQAVSTFINFDDGTTGVAVGSFYSARGVIFSNATWHPTFVPQIYCPGCTTGALLIGPTGLNGMNSAATPIVITFATPQPRVSILANNVGFGGARMVAYDAPTGGTVLGSAQAYGTTQVGEYRDGTCFYHEQFELTVSAISIRRVELYRPAPSANDGVFWDNLTFGTNVTIHQSLSIDPRRTYLRYNDALDRDPLPPKGPPLGPQVFDLAANGIAPGDYLFLERAGRFRWSASFSTEEGRNVWAVFSQNETVLDNPDLDRPLDNPPLIYPPKRIPGAVAPDFQQVAAIVTGRTLTAKPEGVGSPTDFPEDFMADRVLVRVPNAPVAATHLMFGAGDIQWADNLDGPTDDYPNETPADFRISITQIRDPNSDTDGDGASDLGEILSGTDYSNPSSRPSLTISPSPLPGNARTEWTAQAFRIYEIEESQDVSEWSPIESPPLFTVPTLMQRDYPFSPPKRFFRLKVKGLFWD